MKKNLPSDIKSKSLRDTYYMVQEIISKRYEATIKNISDKEIRRQLKDKFNKDIQDTIDYYVSLNWHNVIIMWIYAKIIFARYLYY